MKNLPKIIVILFILYAVFSCGVRKSELKKENEVMKTSLDSFASAVKKIKESQSLKNNKVVKKNIQTKKQDIKLTPKDSTKPIKVTDSEGKETSYFNAIVDIKTKEKKDNTESTETKERTTEKALESNKNTSLKKDIEIKKETKEKVTENKNSWLKLIPFGVFFLLLALFFFFKDKIPFINKFFNK